MRYSVMICAMGLLAMTAGCSQWQPRPVPYAAAESELVLERAIEFPPGTTRIYFQRGKIVTQRQLSVWDHHCALAIDHAFEETVILPAASYSVADTQRRSTLGEWGHGVVTYENNFITVPSTRPLYALYCELWTLGNGYDARRHLSLETLGETVGEWLSLRPVKR